MVNSSTLDGISTHSAREDGDVIGWEIIRATMVISTHSAREDGDSMCVKFGTSLTISTHSAREDGDTIRSSFNRRINNFNPLRPRGRRPRRLFIS